MEPAPPAPPRPDPSGPLDPRPTGPAHPAPGARLTVRAWWDPDLARSGFDPRHPYVERFWLGVVGPSTLLLLRRFARGLEERPSGFRVGLADTARALGLGTGAGRHGPVRRTVERAVSFGLARWGPGGELEVRTHLPPLDRRQLGRLPATVRAGHDRFLADTEGRRDRPGGGPRDDAQAR